MDLRDQLQKSLGTTYTIERELGGGGMSRVFAATETALGRKVVIKVVPMELFAGVNVDRFKREIVVAANLQHPHIVPVLAAGEMDGQPYYTMPFVEGESLRAKLARGPMAISEIIGLLRDVSKALAYAHERGVVHRDIKPDNVLLSGGSATVIDFGIAKAISASRASETGTGLTQVGTSIGTPTYMAPEQAAADPSADHRADIYSFGCMAYELLSGRPPFAGLSPHKMLAAHMGERPQPIEELRGDTPPLLAALVMQCLEKDPDARPQSAADIGRVLDAVTSSETGTVPIIVQGGPRAMVRALVVWALAFVAVYVVAQAAVVGIGLPDWVLPASVILMSLGLPIILLTAFAQRTARRVFVRTPTTTGPGNATHTNSTIETLALRASPHLSWKRTAAIGGYAIGGFIAIVGITMALRAAGIGPFASLMGAGKLKDRDSILVTDFSATGDSTLGAVVSEAVRADLGQSPIVSVVTPAAVTSALQRMQLPPTTKVEGTVATDLARREGIKALVTGDVHSLAGGAGYVITMRLVSADSGQELASLSESAGGGKELIPTIGKLTRQLRSKMGESLKHLQSSPALAQVTTSSYEALQAYTEGQRAMSVELDLDKAIPLFEKAVKIDTSFASAYRALAIALGNSGRDRAGQIAALEKAHAHLDRMPEVERHLAEATYYMQGAKPDLAKARAEYEAVLAIRPTQYAALNNLALVHAQKREFAKAEEYLRRSVASNPTALVAYTNLMTYQAEQGEMAAMDSTFKTQLKMSGNNPRTAMGRSGILYLRGEYAAVDALADSIAKANPTIDDIRQARLGVESSTALARGKLADGLRLASQGNALAAKRGFPGATLGSAVDSAMVEAWFLANKPRALAIVQGALTRAPLATMPPLSRPYAGLAQFYALAGRADLAKEMLSEYDKNTGSMPPEAAVRGRHAILSTIALAENRNLDAAHEAIGADDGPCTVCLLPIIALAYDRANMPDSAIAVYTKYVGSSSIMNRPGTDQYFLAGTYKRLGELWESKGDKAKATGYYGKFVELWKDADPALQPAVVDVKKRIAKLGGTGG